MESRGNHKSPLRERRPLTLDETKRMGLPGPRFREMGEFIVTFQKAPALLSPPPPAPYKEETLWGVRRRFRLKYRSKIVSLSSESSG